MAFSAKTLDFLFENRLQDSRDWFLDHKDTYQAVLLEPMKDLVRSLTPVMLEIDAKVTTEPRVDKTICRLRRDTRYSHDKSLYRDTMWLIFKRGKMHGTEVPGIYFEITCDGFNYCLLYTSGKYYRAGKPSGASGPGRLLLPPLQQPVCESGICLLYTSRCV